MALDDKALRFGAVGIGAVLIGLSVWSMSSESFSYQNSVTNREEQIVDLTEQVSAVSDQAEKETDVSVSDATEILNQAKTVADKIAALENEYMQLLYQDRSTPESEAAFETRQDAIWEVFDQYFGKQNLLRTPWYFADEKIGPGLSWKAMANYKFSGNRVPVVWSCSSENGLYSYVSAVYDAESDTFSDPVKCVTGLGNSILAMTGSDHATEEIDPNTDGIFAIMDQVNESDLPDNRITYTEDEQAEYSKDNEARQEALEQMKEQQQKGADD